MDLILFRFLSLIPLTQNLVLGLLEREPSLRLGGGLRDGHEIKYIFFIDYDIKIP